MSKHLSQLADSLGLVAVTELCAGQLQGEGEVRKRGLGTSRWCCNGVELDCNSKEGTQVCMLFTSSPSLSSAHLHPFIVCHLSFALYSSYSL